MLQQDLQHDDNVPDAVKQYHTQSGTKSIYFDFTLAENNFLTCERPENMRPMDL